ncbi:MAG: T9SS type A sorting domain-containing protein [Lacibacter sp.]
MKKYHQPIRIILLCILFISGYVIAYTQPVNDNCLNATSLTNFSGGSCGSTTAGTVVLATNSLVAAGSCGGTADDDVWYSFTSISGPSVTIALSSIGSNLSTSGTRIELYSGSCGSLTFLSCATSSLTTALPAGNTYYVRVFSAGNTPIVSNGGFSICVRTASPPTPSTLLTGKSFINITRPGGGAVNPGDELEIRVSVNVSVNGTRIYRTRYNDTIPANLNYVAGSMKVLTNEGKVYKAYTDAAGDDQGYYNAATRTVRFNLGRDTTGHGLGSLSSTGIDTSLGGGYFNPQTHFPRANGVLMIVTYRVIVDASVPYNTVFNYGPGALRYRNQIWSLGTTDYELAPNSLTFIVYPNYGLCSNATGANNVSPGSGDFSSGTAHNGANPGTVPGYNYVSVATGNPGDGNYAVVKNLSPSQNTTITTARPETSATHRVFGVWDIIGDHTGAADPLAGNPPAASGANGGYMLAVNSAFQLSVANNQTISGLCENTYYEFSAWFRNVCKRCGIDSAGRGASGVSVNAAYIPTAAGDSSGVKPNLTFQINGIDYYLSGDIDYIGTYGQWVKKGFVFMTGAGQTSVTISIKNNAPGGGGNDWAMDDIEFRTCLPNLEMRPSINPTYCQNGQVDISVAVSTFFNNFSYYQWERSTDNGATWSAAPESPSIQTFSYANSGGTYRDTVALPSFIAIPAVDGYRYRIRTSTSLSNIGVSNCAVYNNDDVVTVDVHPTCDVLPAQVTVFNVELKNSYAAVKWKVKNELSLANYTVERSVDGINFKAIGIVFAKGALVGEEQYLFNDPSKVTDKVYYRLRLTAVEGVSKFSNIVAVSADLQKGFAVSNLVNPFVSKISFQLETYQNGSVDVQLTDASGRMILQRKLQVSRGVNAMVIDVPAQLQSGSYLLRVVGENGVVNKVIQKK